MLAFCSNDYLGLASHPKIVAALKEGADLYGAGSGASHLVSGHSRAHALLEERLAAFEAPHLVDAAALYFCTGYMANLAVLTALGNDYSFDDAFVRQLQNYARRGDVLLAASVSGGAGAAAIARARPRSRSWSARSRSGFPSSFVSPPAAPSFRSAPFWRSRPDMPVRTLASI
jgi:hypothetical protein